MKLNFDEIAGQARNDESCHSELASESFISEAEVILYGIAGQARNGGNKGAVVKLLFNITRHPTLSSVF